MKNKNKPPRPLYCTRDIKDGAPCVSCPSSPRLRSEHFVGVRGKFLLITFLFFFLFLPYFSLAGQFDYQPMEKIPGFETETNLQDFNTYISVIYKFGIWAVGIAALLMITIGGFMYITSAGNNASMEKAKGVITDAIVGLLLALTSWLILYTINPALVTITPLAPTPLTIQPTVLPTTRIGTGNCRPVTTPPGSPCTIANLKASSGFNTDLLAYKASGICNQESRGIETRLSQTDKCKDGTSFSVGLFQINLFAHGDKLGGSCAPINIFNKSGSGIQGTHLPDGRYDCTLKNASLYATCSNLLKNPTTNIGLAYTISSRGATWRPWGANSICGY